jgi:hypothetical protein
VQGLTAHVTECEARLSQDSRNSHNRLKRGACRHRCQRPVDRLVANRAVILENAQIEKETIL